MIVKPVLTSILATVATTIATLAEELFFLIYDRSDHRTFFTLIEATIWKPAIEWKLCNAVSTYICKEKFKLISKVKKKKKNRKTYSPNFRYPHLPCLQVGQKQDCYLPLEVCTIIPCQKRHLSEQQTTNMIRSPARSAPERQQAIQNWVCLLNST